MSSTMCNRCHRKSETKKSGENCLLSNAFQDGPCMGTMHSTNVNKLGLRHLVKHMQTWESHLRRLEHVYIKQDRPLMYHEIRADIKRLEEWRERLDSINPQRIGNNA